MRDEFVNLLIGEDGYREGRNSDGTWNNNQKYSDETPGLEWSDWQPWCATFECWGAHKTSGLEPLWPMTASCYTAVQWWKQRGRFTDYPVLGGPFYMGSSGQDHTGVVVAYDADWIYTIEGNTNTDGSSNGNGVYQRKRPRRGVGSPYGYGVPAYPEGTISADPRLGGTATARVGSGTAPSESIVYTVKSGDTLSGIAASFHVTLDALLGVNPQYKANPDAINIGDTVVIPSAGSATPPPSPTIPPYVHELRWNGSSYTYDDQAKIWQAAMAKRGWAIGAADGYYGPRSASICSQFQQRHGLGVDGVVGPITWNETFNRASGYPG